MSSTRRAPEGTPPAQWSYASSPEFERGLMANLVARRCSVLDDVADRELVWFLQYLSHQEGGLKAIATDLLQKFGDRLGTEAMVKIGKRPGQTYNAEQVRTIRKGLPPNLREDFLLKGETIDCFDSIQEACEGDHGLSDDPWENRRVNLKEVEASRKNPAAYPVSEFTKLCREAAESGVSHNCIEKTASLEEHLRCLCLDPDCSFRGGEPWYFPRLASTLRDYMEQWIATRAAGIVVTTLGAKVHETLDYTLHAGMMTLLEGDARTGKSFSARTWCEQHPGQARFVEVPVGNDMVGFYRALARGLGIGSFQQYKAVEIRERVESVLLTGDILLCLDEAHRLWPQMNQRYGFPKRIEWVMSMANPDKRLGQEPVPICLIATPQFIAQQKACEQKSGWNSAQFMGRLGHYEPLPRELEVKDLIAVAKSILPEAEAETLRELAAYARKSARYLAAIDAIAKRARYIAQQHGRDTATTKEIENVMLQSVIPSDSKLVRALAVTGKPSHKRTPSPLVDAQSDGEDVARRMPARGVQPAANGHAPSINRLAEPITSEA